MQMCTELKTFYQIDLCSIDVSARLPQQKKEESRVNYSLKIIQVIFSLK